MARRSTVEDATRVFGDDIESITVVDLGDSTDLNNESAVEADAQAKDAALAAELPETPAADPETGEVVEDDGPAEPATTEPAPETGTEPEQDPVPARGHLSEQAQLEAERVFGLPRDEVFIDMRGGAKYLPARRRVQWMRGEIEQHPLWTIETREIQVVPGEITVTKNSRGMVVASEVAGGYARIEAGVYDEHGRLIASGRKTEYSERFTDFVEKAETGAIARALAVAGYGTEAALDLDEGLEAERIADAPVGQTGRPISITSSAIPNVGVGGRTAHITDAQIDQIARLTRELGLGQGLTSVIDAATGKPVVLPTGVRDATDVNKAILAHLRRLTSEEGGAIVQALQKAATARERSEDDGRSTTS